MKWQTKRTLRGWIGGGEALACERDIPRERRRTTPYTPGANQLSNSDTFFHL